MDINWPEVLIGLVLSLVVGDQMKNLPKLSEKITVYAASRLKDKKMAAIRESEWLGQLEEMPSDFGKLLQSLGFLLASFRMQRGGKPDFRSILVFIVSTGRMLARLGTLGFVMVVPYSVILRFIGGGGDLTLLLPIMAVYTWMILGLQTDFSDFSWHPKIEFSQAFSEKILGLHLASIILMIFLSSLGWKIFAVCLLVGYWLILEEDTQKKIIFLIRKRLSR